MKHKFRPKKLKLGAKYLVRFSYRNYIPCKFIQPTRCGFNFLNLKTNKCILRRHLYRSKYEDFSNDTWFFISDNIEVIEVNEINK